MNDLAFISALKNQTLRFLPRPDPLDDALRALSVYGPSLKSGFIDHGPMAAEALEAMGRGTDITGYITQHLASGTLLPAPEAQTPIDPDRWQVALGQGHLFGDWCSMLESELHRDGWKALARRWCVRLTPGATTAALHGLIRTAHAVRALERRDSPERRTELVRALASWAALYGEPPWPAVRGLGTLSPDVAFGAITPAPTSQRAPQGSIAAGLGFAMNAPDFADEVARVDMTAPVEDVALAMALTLAHAFLSEARSGYTAIVWCHALTATVSVRRLTGVLSAAEARTLLTRVFEAACAMRAAFADLHADRDPGADRIDTPEQLIQRAVDCGDDHAIKLTDALLEIHHACPEPVFLKAADRAIRMLG